MDIAAPFRETFRLPFFRILLAIIAIVLGLLAVATRSTSLGDRDLIRNDFTVDYLSGAAVLHGQDAFDPLANLAHYAGPSSRYYEPATFVSRNVHPPADIAIMTPIAALPYRPARILWLIAMAACSGFAVGLLARALGVSFRWSIVVGIGALAVPIFQKDLLYGQPNGLLLLLLVLGWLSLRKNSDRAAGVLLGITAALKLYPAVMAIPLIRERRWRALGWMVGTFVVATAGGVLVIGETATRELVKPATPDNFAFWRAAPMNLSLPGIAYRWLTKSHWRAAGVDAPRVAGLLALILVALCVVAMIKTPARLSGRYWATVPLMLLATPLVWDTYLVLIAPVLFAVLMSRRIEWWLLLALAILAIGIPPALPSPPANVSDVAQVLGYALPTYALIVVAISEWRLRGEAEPVYSV